VIGSPFVGPLVGILFAILPVAVVGALAFRLRRAAGDRPERIRFPDRRAAVPLLLAAIVAIAFTAMNARAGFVTDGFNIWAAKAKVLAIEGHLDPRDGEPQRLGRVADYPPVVPLTEALVAERRDRFDFGAAKLVFPVFFVSLLAGTWALARRLPPASAAWAVAIVALLPAVSTDWNVGGFADLPLAAAVATGAGAWMRRSDDRSTSPAAGGCVAGILPLIKPEGFILLACGALACALSGRSRGKGAKSAALLPLAAFLAVAGLFRFRYGVPEGQYGPLDAAHWAMAVRRILPVAGLCLQQAASLRLWGPFWFVAGPAAAITALRGRGSERALASFVAFAGLAFASIFLFSNWGFPGSPAYGGRSLAFEIAGGFPRILEQIAAPAAVVAVGGWKR
jgi:hypothetical protein